MSSILILLFPRYVGPTGKNKKATNSTHNKRTCKICLKQESAGLQVFQPTNPNYLCIFKGVNWNTLPPTYPHPFPLTSLPNDRIGKMLSVTQRILLKIKATKNPVYLGWQPYVDMLERGFWDLRSEFYVERIIGCAQDPKLVLDLIRKTFQDPLSALVEKTGNFVIVKDEYKLWATFTLLTELIISTAFVAVESALKSPGSMLPNHQTQVFKNDHFLEVVEKITNALDQEVVPHSELAAIACGGNIEQSCNQCDKKITIAGIFHRHVRKSIPEVVFNHGEKSRRYVCETSQCWEKESRRETEETTLRNVSVYATFLRFYDTRCDKCFLLARLKEVHRSMCLTKNYCSQICRDADTDVHKVCCNPDQRLQKVDERKVRIGGRQKTEAANARIDSYAKSIESTGDPVLDEKIQQIIVKTRKALKVSEKRQNQIDEVD